MKESDAAFTTSGRTPVENGVANRRIVHRTRGERDGPITRLMSPEDLGEVLKPFVFLDLFEVDAFAGRGFASASSLRNRDAHCVLSRKYDVCGLDREIRIAHRRRC